MPEPQTVKKLKKILKSFHDVVNEFGAESEICPFQEHGEDCMATELVQHCNILDCPLEEVQFDWEAINNANI